MPVIPEVPIVGPTPEITKQRELTYAFIQADPTLVTLTPVLRVKQPSGSYLMVDQPARPVQTFKMIPLTAGQKPTIVLNGIERIADYAMVGMHDAVVEVGDHWMMGNQKFTVIETADGHGYETKVLVEAHGSR